MRVRIQPYHPASLSARALSRGSGMRRINLIRTRFQPRSDDIIINWGSGRALFPERNYLNIPAQVAVAGNKLRTLQALCYLVPLPEWTTNIDIARTWHNMGHTVVMRHELRGHSGRGIEVVGPDASGPHAVEELREAPLYTLYIPRAREYRVHVWQGKVIDMVQKKRRSGETPDNNVRSAELGWVFCRNNMTPYPYQVEEYAVNAIDALALDFGAVDVLWKGDNVYVLEVNTAPGLEGTTCQRYIEAITSLGGTG